MVAPGGGKVLHTLYLTLCIPVFPSRDVTCVRRSIGCQHSSRPLLPLLPLGRALRVRPWLACMHAWQAEQRLWRLSAAIVTR